MLSGTAEYALRAVVHLAREPHHAPVRASDLADATGVPRNYLGKILHELVRGGVLKSSRGKKGGFQLAVPAERLPLLRVVALFDQINGERRCLLGRPECSDVDPCPVHHRWKAASEQISKFFRDTMVGDVID
ncbi:MAG: Rrf2 family transcriptional regulator [Gemmatimonadales bacterium]|jgi:Rrf2 family protein